MIVRLVQGNVPQSEKFDPQLIQRGIASYMQLAALPPKEADGAPDLIVLPLNTPSASAPFDIRRNTLGSGQAGVWVSSRSTARGPRISTPCPPSPPSTFCQLKVATSILRSEEHT